MDRTEIERKLQSELGIQSRAQVELILKVVEDMEHDIFPEHANELDELRGQRDDYKAAILSAIRILSPNTNDA